MSSPTTETSTTLAPRARLVAGRAAFDEWKAESLIPRVFEVEAQPERFRSRITFAAFGATAALRYEMSAARHSRTAERARRDGYDMIWVQLASTGRFAGSSPGSRTTVEAGAGALCDFSSPVEQFAAAGSGHALLIPRAAFARDPRALHGAAIGAGRNALLRDYVEWLCVNAGRARVRDADAAARAVATVVEACFSTPGRASVDAEVAVQLGPIALHRARAFIAGRLCDADLRAGDIARAAGVSRATLYRLCAPLGGVVELVWSMRLEAVRKALSASGASDRLVDLAEAYGFTSQQHLSRRFSHAYGFSPRNLRPF